ncbi:MAG: hypothetical protein M1834_001982 [Cirrosporium novae-zelandiae]|nr:MAG: hypothetical protein M1834_001982 [Cirrosporium novae-zelandiae]
MKTETAAAILAFTASAFAAPAGPYRRASGLLSPPFPIPSGDFPFPTGSPSMGIPSMGIPLTEGSSLSIPTGEAGKIEKRQLSGLGGVSGLESLSGLPSISIPGGIGSSFAIPTASAGLGSLSSGSSSGLGSLGSAGGSPASSEPSDVVNLEERQGIASGLGSLGSLGSGSGTSSGLGSLSSGLGSLDSGSSSGLGSLSSLGGSSESSSGLGDLTGLEKRQGIASGLGSLGSLGSGTGTSSGLGSLTSGLGSLDSGSSSGLGSLSSLGGSSESSSGLGDLTGLEKRQGIASGVGSLGSGTSSGLGSLTSGLSLGSGTSSGLGSLTSGIGGLGSLGSGTSSGFGSLSSLGSSSGLSGLSGSTVKARGSSEENDVTNKASCKPLTVVFARGSSESGNVGTIAGPPMFSALKSSLGDNSVNVQGVDYDASIAGNAELGANGGPVMVKLVKEALSQCPNTKIAISGYSQGAMVVHNAAGSLSADQVDAVVVFGDPENGSSLGSIADSKVKSFCASGDSLCGSTGTGSGTGHLSYGEDADKAASFIISTTGVSSSS